MADSEDIREWADREKLSSDIVNVLDELGFDTLETLRLLTIDEVTESIQKPKLLPLAKCLKLKKALGSLSGPTESAHPTSSAKTVTFSTEAETEGHESRKVRPSEEPWQTIKPQPGHVSRARKVFEDVKEGVWSFFGGEPEEEEYFRFLLLGKTGSGKSSTGNTIFGEKLFASYVAFGSVTQTCELKSCKKGGKLIDIMDSPGLYDTSKTQEEICTIIVQAVACMHPGPHAILYVVKMGRYTDEEYGVYNRLKRLFDASITKYIIILFTGGDELEAAGKTLADMLRVAPEKLIEVVEECNHRCMIFNNKAKDKQPQVNRLLDQVRKMNAENNNIPYACPKYASVGEGLEAEVARRLAEVNKRDAEREQYVKELEERKAKAEEELKRTKEDFQRKEREREKELREEREKREREKEELREKLKKKETEVEIQEKKKKSTGKDENREEEEKKAEALSRQQEELRQSILRREREQEELLKRLEEERKREREEIRRREQEREELERKRREEERKEKERQRRAYEEEMRRMKEQIAENKEQGWVEWATKGVSNWLGSWW